MKFLTPAIAAVVLCVAYPAFAQDAKMAMVDFCKAYGATWTDKGATAVAPMFAPDVVFTAGNGAVVRGRDALMKVFNDIYKEPTTHKCVIDEAHAAGPTSIWTVGEVTITGKPAGHIRFSTYAIKTSNNDWQIQMLGVTPIPEPTK